MKKSWKKQLTALLLLGAMLLSLSACNPASPAPLQGKTAKTADLMLDIKAQPVSGKKCDALFQKAGLSFAAELLKESFGVEGGKNLLLSPLSVLTALGMTANGAAGETLREMEQLLLGGIEKESGERLSLEDLNQYMYQYYKSLPSTDESRFTFGNSIWMRDGFTVEKEFLQRNKDYYNPDMYMAPFDESTLRDINQWVDQRSNHMIPKVLEDLSPGDMIALINVLLFDAKWEQPFGSNSILPGRFTSLKGAERKVKMMSNEESLLIDEGDTIGIMKAYAGDKYRFVAFMPREADADFERYLNALDGEKIQKLLTGVKNREVMLGMPQLTVEYKTDLCKALRNMGMKKALDGTLADFSRISADTRLSISQIIHQTKLELDNDGTKAAAVTVVMATKAAAPQPGRIDAVILDRPFVYMIVDTENMLPLFMGAVTDIE